MATLAEDGSPRLVPITFATVGEVVGEIVGELGGRIGGRDVVFSAVDDKPKSTPALARLRRIERDPRVCLLADAYSEDWSQLWWVRADARAEVLTDGAEWDTAIAFLQHKYQPYRLRPPTGAVIRFVVSDWSGWTAS